MNKTDRVWGYNSFEAYEGKNSEQCRCITVAASMSALVRATGISRHFLNDYACETGNEAEIEIATSDPSKIFYRSLQNRWRAGGWESKDKLELK